MNNLMKSIFFSGIFIATNVFAYEVRNDTENLLEALDYNTSELVTLIPQGERVNLKQRVNIRRVGNDYCIINVNMTT